MLDVDLIEDVLELDGVLGGLEVLLLRSPELGFFNLQLLPVALYFLLSLVGMGFPASLSAIPSLSHLWQLAGFHLSKVCLDEVEPWNAIPRLQCFAGEHDHPVALQHLPQQLVSYLDLPTVRLRQHLLELV